MNRFYSVVLGLGLSAGWIAFGQQTTYIGKDVTGQLALARVVNPVQAGLRLRALGALPARELKPPRITKRLRPPLSKTLSMLGATSLASLAQSLPVVPATGKPGFKALSHYDQYFANDGIPYSIEPPSPAIAVANGFIVQGVNNAFQVYNTSGAPLLPAAISTNELFGVPDARTANGYGVYPTDMRVFFDQTISRWFVLQRSLDNDIFGNTINSSHLYMAVSQTADPTGNYNIYVMDTTNPQNPGCPCLPDYPQIGADQYGFYISVNEFNTFSERFVDAAILAISKKSLGSGAALPPVHRFLLPFTTGYEFAIQPATTPPGASYFIASGGLGYFVSSQSRFSVDGQLAVWAMYNTASIDSANPSLLLAQITAPALSYTFPDVATQRTGPLPYGSTLSPPGSLAFLDGGDTRVLSAVYSGGRLYATLSTKLFNENGRPLVGAAYVIFSPTFRAGILAARALRQGYILAKDNHVLRPAIAMNPQGRGAIAFTLVGPDYFPSAAFLPLDTFSTATAIQLAGAGVLPEDGFTGYPGGFGPGEARWGDYSGAVAASDGTIWMVAQHIPGGLRTEFANWGTFIWRYVP